MPVVTRRTNSSRSSFTAAQAGGDSPEAFGAYLRSGIAKWAAVTKRIGIKPE